MYTLEYSDVSLKFLAKLPKYDSQEITEKLDKVSAHENPKRFMQKMQNSPFWRLLVMDYRVIADIIIKGKKIYVVRIGKRENVYD